MAAEIVPRDDFLILYRAKKAIRRSINMRKVNITETVLRDANQSLIATRLPYSKFEPILETMDKAGFYSAEVWGGATFDVCLRYLQEDP